MKTKSYVTNGEYSNKKGRIIKWLQKQCVKIRTKSLIITDISTYQVKFEYNLLVGRKTKRIEICG